MYRYSNFVNKPCPNFAVSYSICDGDARFFIFENDILLLPGDNPVFESLSGLKNQYEKNSDHNFSMHHDIGFGLWEGPRGTQQ